MAATSTTRGNTREEQVIAAARATRDAMTGLEVELLLHAVAWVELHPGRPGRHPVEWGCGTWRSPATAPRPIDEGAVAEFALAIGHSTDSGRRYRVTRSSSRIGSRESGSGCCPGGGGGKARRIAQATMSLPPEGGGRRQGAVLRRSPVLVCGDRPAGGEGAQGARPGRDRTPPGRGGGEAARERPPGGDDPRRAGPDHRDGRRPTRLRSRTTSPPRPRGWTRRSRCRCVASMVLGMLGGRHGDAPGEGSAPGVMVFVHTAPAGRWPRWTTPGRPPPSNKSGTGAPGPAPRSPSARSSTWPRRCHRRLHPTGPDGRAGQAPPPRVPVPRLPPPSRPGAKAKRRKKTPEGAANEQQQEHGSDLDHRQSGPRGRRCRPTCSHPAAATTASRPSPTGPTPTTRPPGSPGPARSATPTPTPAPARTRAATRAARDIVADPPAGHDRAGGDTPMHRTMRGLSRASHRVVDRGRYRAGSTTQRRHRRPGSSASPKPAVPA